MARSKRTRSTVTGRPLGRSELRRIDAWWRAANYLSVGQIYLMDNPLLRSRLLPEHVKPRLLGHWGTTPGLNFVYAHLNRVIAARELDMMYVIGPGHGGPGWSRRPGSRGPTARCTRTSPATRMASASCSASSRSPAGSPATLRRRHRAPSTRAASSATRSRTRTALPSTTLTWSWPPSSVTVRPRPGRLATSWHSNKFVDPRRDGAVLPILHLNGYKIANPTVLARIDDDELDSSAAWLRSAPYVVEGVRPERDAPGSCRDAGPLPRRDPRHPARGSHGAAGSGGPTSLADDRVALAEGVDRSQGGRRPAGRGVLAFAPGAFADARGDDAHRDDPRGMAAQLSARGAVRRRRRARRRRSPTCIRRVTRRMSANPHANGGLLLRDLRMPDFRDYAVEVVRTRHRRGRVHSSAGHVPARRDVANMQNFRMFAPDENNSNRLQDVLEVTNRTWNAETLSYDDHLAVDGRVMEILSEHTCEGWLEGYLLTGRHGLFSCYEAFIHSSTRCSTSTPSG